MLLIMMMKITLKQPAWSLPGILQRWRLTGRGTSQSPVYDNCDGDDGGNNGAVDNKGDDRESTTVRGLQWRTCMLRWLNRLIPSSLIAIHSSEPSIVYNWQWCQLWGGNGKFGDDDNDGDDDDDSVTVGLGSSLEESGAEELPLASAC